MKEIVKCLQTMAKLIDSDNKFRTAKFNHWLALISKRERTPLQMIRLNEKEQEAIKEKRKYEWALRSILRSLEKKLKCKISTN